MQAGALLSFSPSFNSYSSTSLGEIAARVAGECRADQTTDLSCQEDAFCFDHHEKRGQNFLDDDSDDDDDEFEFCPVTIDVDSSTISADDIFSNGQIRHVFPVFGKEIFPSGGADDEHPAPPPVTLPLGKLLNEERRRQQRGSTTSSSCSSLEADELHGVPPGTYCVWKPKTSPGAAALQRPKKSNSTGSSSLSSKRWRLRELVRRSNSDGKENFALRVASRSTSQVAAAPVASGGAAAATNGVRERR